jgi:CDP-2,3-bis-(O-geranylgeranyl)-sn-glycerol synthase
MWVMIPAYVPNPVAAVVGGGTPIDLGRTLADGKRMFGDGKTYRGLFGGIAAGICTGFFLLYIEMVLGVSVHTPLSVVLLAAGALLGDLVKSFVKRRLGKDRGEKWLLADQYDLVAGALLLTAACDPGWIAAHITPLVLGCILVITPVLHRGANIIGYLTGVKDVPW